MSSRATPTGRTGPAEPSTASDLFAALADGRRRRIAAALRGRPDGLTEDELTTFVASAEADVPLTDLSEEQYERVLVSLRHRHLPMLDDAGLLQREGEQVEPADPELFEDGLVGAVLDVDAPAGEIDAALEVFAAVRRRIALDRLRTEGSTTVTELAAAVAAAQDCSQRDVHVSLVHTHLPKLAEAGVVSDANEGASEERRVRYEGLPVGRELFGLLDDLEEDLLPYLSA